MRRLAVGLGAIAVALGLVTPVPASAAGGLGAAVRDARATGSIGFAQARAYRRTVARVRRTAARLDGTRGAELRAVVADARALADAGGLTVGRMPLTFLTLRRNERFWRTAPQPAAGARTRFGADPAVFQFFPGHGLQYHALATAGKANAIAKPCVARAARVRALVAARAARLAAARRRGSLRRRGPNARPTLRRAGCRPARLAAGLDRLTRLAAVRDGYVGFEYQVRYAGATGPWVSGMAQATAAQALSRGADALGDARYRVAALSALGAFDVAPPGGVAVRRDDGREYLLYSFDPGLRVLNGFLQSLVGLHDVAELTGSPKARALFAAGDRVARDEVAAFDTGAWSRYSLAGRESTLDYHELVTGFLEGLCTRTRRAAYCDTGARFARYTTEPPRIGLDLPGGRPREDRALSLRLRISKVSAVRATVTGPRGTALRVDTRLPRGAYAYDWTPPAGGTYRVTAVATGPEGRTATRRAVVRVRAKPRPKPRKRPGRLLLGRAGGDDGRQAPPDRGRRGDP